MQHETTTDILYVCTCIMTEMSLVKLYCKIISFVLLSNYISVVDPFVGGAHQIQRRRNRY